mmetsp:Transcript_87162/g.202910  ORF Transcript_87162/g.202910 Transcript_87162/m.202910 type:complete len:269 (+) Transcript_87162:534-1340(+)
MPRSSGPADPPHVPDVQCQHSAHELLQGVYAWSFILPAGPCDRAAGSTHVALSGSAVRHLPRRWPGLLRVPRSLPRCCSRRHSFDPLARHAHLRTELRHAVRRVLQLGPDAAVQEQGHPRGRGQGRHPAGLCLARHAHRQRAGGYFLAEPSFAAFVLRALHERSPGLHAALTERDLCWPHARPRGVALLWPRRKHSGLHGSRRGARTGPQLSLLEGPDHRQEREARWRAARHLRYDHCERAHVRHGAAARAWGGGGSHHQVPDGRPRR